MKCKTKNKRETVPIVFEARGEKENALLHTEFDNIINSSGLDGIKGMFKLALLFLAVLSRRCCPVGSS